MLTFTKFTLLAAAGGLVASQTPPVPPMPNFPGNSSWPVNKKCGEVNVIFTGFPPHHLNVNITTGNYSLEYVDKSLRNDTANAVKAGYNIHVILQGLDQPASNIADRMKGKHWDITGVGFGQRGSDLEDVTHRVEDVLILYRQHAPNAPHLFNWSPTTFTEALKYRVPLVEDCTDKPGKLITYEEVCTPEFCKNPIVITDGSVDELLNLPS